jgi:hypothetical protein
VPGTQNIFLIGRESGAEDQLTEMLVWLTSAVPDVGAAVIRLAFGDIELDLAQLEASTQLGIAKGRLDAVFTAQSLVLVVESKLKSAYGDEQLAKYVDWLASDHKDCAHRALMTLTEREAPWPKTDIEHAAALGVVPTARRWQDLFVVLAQLAAEPDRDPLSSRVVQEFLDMLTEEGLIPMKPLEGEELLDAWSRSEAVIRRYHDYFRACKDAVAKELDARPHPNRSSATPTHIYHDFETHDGELIGVGLSYSDHVLTIKPKVYRDSPVAWLTIEATDWPDWESAIARLESMPPEGWQLNPDRWYYRPQVWRYLDDVVGTGTFDEQRARFVAACGQARNWLETARPASA